MSVSFLMPNSVQSNNYIYKVFKNQILAVKLPQKQPKMARNWCFTKKIGHLYQYSSLNAYINIKSVSFLMPNTVLSNNYIYKF